MKRIAAAAMFSCAGVLVAGCAPADISGMYTASLTNGMNGCSLMLYTVGDTSSGVTMTVTQTQAAVSGEVTGLAAAALNYWVDGHIFTGTVSGSHADMVIHGTAAHSQGGCPYTLDARFEGDLTGDALQGSITYSANAADSAACATIRQCRTVQTFSASRPPRS
jgi:hypothetical protein